MSNRVRVNEKISEKIIDILNVKLPELIRNNVENANADYVVKSIEFLEDEGFFRVRFNIFGRDDEYVWFFRI